LEGIGASVPHRLYREWADWLGPDLALRLSYLPLGSGAGQRAARAREADFGASDSALSDDDLRSSNLLQVPTVSAALGFVVNLPGIDTARLRIGRADLAAIFAGEIRVWSDARLRATNPDIELPHLAITPVIRREASGSTDLVARWLSGGEVPVAEADNPLGNVPGLAVFGARGVAQTVRRLRGSISYLEVSAARQSGLNIIDLETPGGGYATLLEGADTLFGSRDAAMTGSETWPILTRTHVLIPLDRDLSERSAAVARFFRHCLVHGGSIASTVGFVPLAPEPRDTAVAALEALCACG
jgi:phosphate transport system substrate-binding protein